MTNWQKKITSYNRFNWPKKSNVLYGYENDRLQLCRQKLNIRWIKMKEKDELKLYITKII